MAGAISGFIVTPIDVVKSRLMTGDFGEKVPSMGEVMRDVYAERGI